MPRTYSYNFTSLCCHVVEMRRTVTAPPSHAPIPTCRVLQTLLNRATACDSYTTSRSDTWCSMRPLLASFTLSCTAFLCASYCACLYVFVSTLPKPLASPHGTPRQRPTLPHDSVTLTCLLPPLPPIFCSIATQSLDRATDNACPYPAETPYHAHTHSSHTNTHTPFLSPPPHRQGVWCACSPPPGVSFPASLHHAGHRHFVPFTGWTRCLGSGQSRPRAPTRHRAYASSTPCGRT